MKLIKTDDEFIKELHKQASLKPKYFYFASYRLFVDKDLKKILNSLPKTCDVKIIVGVDDKISNAQVEFYKRELSNYNVKVIKNCHLKAMITPNNSIIGGRNYTRSNWIDLSIVIPKGNDGLKTYFNNVYNKAK